MHQSSKHCSSPIGTTRRGSISDTMTTTATYEEAKTIQRCTMRHAASRRRRSARYPARDSAINEPRTLRMNEPVEYRHAPPSSLFDPPLARSVDEVHERADSTDDRGEKKRRVVVSRLIDQPVTMPMIPGNVPAVFARPQITSACRGATSKLFTANPRDTARVCPRRRT